MSEEEKKTVKKKSSSSFLTTAVFFILLGALIAGGGVYQLARKYPDVLGLQTTITQEEETKKLLGLVGKLMDLPKDESPTITTVSDSDKEKSESYFANAKNGDKIIAYTKSKRIILYRPSENKIMDVGFISNSQTPPASEQPASKSMSIFIFNGTDTVGATKGIEAKLLDIYDTVQISGRAVASKTDYPDTIVIDLVGNRGEDSKKIATDLGISVGSLPEGEKKPDKSDFLIIVGKNSLPVAASATPSATPAQQ